MLSAENIEKAVALIDKIFLDTPQFTDAALSRALNRDLWLKLETLNPIRSFKGRGVDFFMQHAAGDQRVVCASAGNFGQAIAFTATRLGASSTVFCAANANQRKVASIRGFGADVVLTGDDFDAAKAAARQYADASADRLFVEDGADPLISEGAGTIAIELVAVEPDVLLVPVGNGALISGVARWIRSSGSHTRVVGVCAAGAPAMAESWRARGPVAGSQPATIADGVAVREPVLAAVEWMVDTVDDVVLVDDYFIIRALATVRDTVGLILEPAAVLGIAALLQHDIPGDRLATILTGSNFSDDLLSQLTRAAA
jgi:threonine dehydratase